MSEPNQPKAADSVEVGKSLSERKRRLSKLTKLDASAFAAEWRSHISSQKDPLPSLRAMCKAGIAGEILDATIDDLSLALLENPRLAERLGLHLALRKQFGKSNPLSRRLLNRLRPVFEASIAFEVSDFVGYRAEYSLQEWVVNNSPTQTGEFESWMRRASIAILGLDETTLRSTGLFAIEREWTSRGRKEAKPDQIFAQALVAALAAPRINRAKLQSLCSGIHIFESERRDILDRERNLQMSIRANLDTIHAQEQKIAILSAQLEASQMASSTKDSLLAARESDIVRLQEQLKLVDRHWEGVSEQQLAKQGGTLRSKVDHELQEALLALDREDPNVSMALNRLRRIEGIVKE